MRRLLTVVSTAFGLAAMDASAAPCAGFNDVSDADATYCAAVTYVKNKGITLGCAKPGGPNYCPDDPVTRLQMALFLQRVGRGGPNNVIGDYRSTIGGGDHNTSNAIYSTVAGGNTNSVTVGSGTVGGGSTNLVSGSVGVVAGGIQNQVTGPFSAIGGGYLNGVSGAYSTIGGGTNNSVSGNQATVSGGGFNVVSGDRGSIAGGQNNHATGIDSTVGGGSQNSAGGQSATVAGGDNNAAGGLVATIGGGSGNTVDGDFATVAGGGGNIASTDGATISGGAYNYASGVSSTIPGGSFNVAAGSQSFAAGNLAHSNADGCFTWGDTSTGNAVTCGLANGFVARALGGVYFLTSGNQDSNYHGAQLAPGSGSWTTYSDRNGKDRIVPVDSGEVLSRVLAMPVATWHYKPQDEAISHMGPMAQDFYAAFGLGETDKGISTVDAQGVALAAIQGLNAKLEARNAELEARLARLEALLAR